MTKGWTPGPLRWRLRLRRLALVAFAVALIFLAADRIGRPLAPSQAGASSYTFGVENSWVRVQNIGVADTRVEVQYYDESGAFVAADSCPRDGVCAALPPGGGWTFFQRDAFLPSGFRGSAIVVSEQPVVVLQAKDVVRGGAFLIDGNTIDASRGSHRIYIPLIANRDGPQQDWNGRFALQNVSDSVQACVTITYLSNYTDGEIAWDPYNPATPGQRLPGCPNGGRPIPPRGTLFRDPETMGIPPGFTGSVRIDTHTNAAGVPPSGQWLSATGDTYNSIYNPLSSFHGLDESQLGREIILPLVDREVGPDNQWSTYFQIENKNPAQPADVTIRFEGWALSANLPQYVVKQNTLRVVGARMCFQARDDYANCLAPGDALPFNFVGTARLLSSQPIGVIVNRSSKYIDVFTNYRAFRPDEGGTRVLLPVLNKNYGPYNGRAGWNSWFRVMVADGGAANVTVTYYGLDLPGGQVSYTMPVFREATVFQYNEWQLPDGFAGTAVLTSDRPIVALANLTTDVFYGDTDLLYNGIALQ